MWAYKAWQGLHFPDGVARRDQLPVYASWCNAVEGNTTFYGLPAPRTVASWAAEAPEGFRFLFKLPRAITHEHRLEDAGEELQPFLAEAGSLGTKLGPLLVQLPPSLARSRYWVSARTCVSVSARRLAMPRISLCRVR